MQWRSVVCSSRKFSEVWQEESPNLPLSLADSSLRLRLPSYPSHDCTSLHFTVLHCTELIFTALHYTVLHCTELLLYYIALHWTNIYCIDLNWFHCVILYSIALQCIAFHCSFCFVMLQYFSLYISRTFIKHFSNTKKIYIIIKKQHPR